jgi:hypothetical protein
LRTVLLILALVSLAVCLVIGLLVFYGTIDGSIYRTSLAVASLAWFGFATMYATRKAR